MNQMHFTAVDQTLRKELPHLQFAAFIFYIGLRNT